MKADWIQVRRGDISPNAAGYYVTMNPKGRIAFNRVTHQRMDEPDAVHLLYDKVNNRIGLKPTSRAMRDAYPVRVSQGRGDRAVAAYRLVAEFGIDLPVTVEFRDAEIDQDGILILDLRTAKPSTRALGWEKRRQKT